MRIIPFLLALLAASPGFAATADKSYTNGNVSYTVQSTDTAWSQLLDIEGASSCAVQANLAATETFTLASRASGAVSPDDAATSLTVTESGAYTFTPGTPFFSVKFNVLGDSNSIVGIVCDPAGGTDADLSMDLSTITFPAAGSGGASALGELTDVDLATAAPTTGQLLSWDGSNWVPATDADTIYDDTALQGQVDSIPVINALGDIAGVDLATAAPTTGQLLSWDGSNWVPATDADTIYDDTALQGQVDSIPVINALGDIADVDAAAPTDGQVLSWSGSNWVPGQASVLQGDWPASSTANVYGLNNIFVGDGEYDFVETALNSPKWVSGLKYEPIFNLDGEKADCTSGSDSTKPWFDCEARTGLFKTKSNGLYLQMTNLSPGEAHMISADLITGGDTDPNGMHLRVQASGGTQTAGDEGINGIRLVTNPNWGATFGTLDGDLSAATGTAVPVDIAGVTTYETNFVGVGKMFVISGSPEAFSVTLADQSSSSPQRPKQSVLQGFPNNGGTRGSFLLDSDLDARVDAGNWCMYDPAMDYFAGGTGPADTHFWLRISEVARSTDVGNPPPSFTTSWYSQGIDLKYPNKLMWSGEYHFAPCYTITKVEQDPSTKVTNRVYVHKTVNHTELSGADWEVTPYGELKQTGVKVLQTANIFPAFSGAAFTAVHEVGAAFGSRYQLPKAFSVEHSGNCITADRATSCIEDGYFGAFEVGMEVDEWSANKGIRYRYPDADSSTGFSLAEIRPTTGQSGLNWGLTGSTARFHTVIDVYQHTDKSIILNGTYGWGVGRTGTKWFPLISTGTVTGHTDGQFLTWSDGEGAYVETAPGLDDLTGVDLTTAAPTNGDALTFDGTNWVPGAGGGGGTNTSFSNFPAIGTSETALFSGSSTIGLWNSSYTAFAFGGTSFTATLPEITSISDVHKRVEIWVEPGVTLTLQGHANDATALGFNVVTTGAGTATMTFTAPASDIACKVEVFVRGDNQVITSSTCPTQTLSNP